MNRAFIQIENTDFILIFEKDGIKTIKKVSSDVIGLTKYAEDLNWDCEENERYYVVMKQN